jgi:crossover junction endodeoxyribonuclease RuvC
MRILGIDPGTKFVGYAVLELEDGTAHLIDGGTHRIGAKDKISRIAEVYNLIKNIIGQFAPDVLVVEELFYAKNIKTLVRLAEIRSVVMLSAKLQDVPVREFSPKEIKLAITGSGNASKERVAFMVSSILGLDRITEYDFSDAVATALCYVLRRE